MANKIKVTYTVKEDGSLGKIKQGAEQAAASTDKASKSSERYSKRNKGVAGATSNSTKAFSKMTTGIEGGLVPAYATLAAHVFAVTAAFGLFRRNAAIEQLNQGLIFTGRAAGNNLPLIVQGLQDITDGAVSAADAMRATALGISAGFDQSQIEGLTRVAKGASQALGRDMTDALDRLTRGAAKLEPEILDELGIMVRLDTVTKDYAAALGKTSAELTQFERRMAFTNAIIEQGEDKFGNLTVALDVNPFDKLAATFDNFIKIFVGGINKLAGPIVGFVASSIPMLVGSMLLLGTSVIKMMIPALTAGGAAMATQAASAAANARAQLGALTVFKGAPAIYSSLAQAVASGNATMAQKQQLIASLQKSEAGHQRTMAASLKAHTAEGVVYKQKVITLHQVQHAMMLVTAATALDAEATLLHTRATVMDSAASGQLALTLQGLVMVWAEEILATQTATAANGIFARSLAMIGTVAKLTAFSLKALGVTVMSWLPWIGLITMAVMALISVFKTTQPIDKWKDTFADAQDRFDEFPNIIEQLNVALDASGGHIESFGLSIAVTSGLMGQLKTQMHDFIQLEQKTERTELARAKTASRLAIEATEAAKAKLALIPKDPNAGRAKSIVFDKNDANQSLLPDPHYDARVAAIREQDEAYRDTLAAATALAAAQEAMGILDPKTYEGIMLTLIEGQQAFEEMASRKDIGKDELQFIKNQQAGVEGMLERLRVIGKMTDDVAKADAILELGEDFGILSDRAMGVQNSFEGAGKIVSEVSALFATAKSRTGAFNGELTTMDKALNMINTGADFDTILEQYKEVFDLFGIDTTGSIADATNEFRVLHGEFSAFAQEVKNQGMYDEALSQRLLEGATDHQKILLKQERAKEVLAHKEEALRLATIMGVDVEKAKLAVLKAQTKEKQLQIDRFKNYGDQMRDAGAGEGASRALAAGGAVANAQAGVDAANKTSDDYFSSNFGKELDQDTLAANANAKDQANTVLQQAQQAQMKETMAGVAADMAKLGPEGALMSSAIGGALAMQTAFSTAFQVMNDDSTSTADRVQAGLAVAGAAINALGSMMAASSADKIRGIDQEIAKEKQRDGTSKASVAKIAQLEKKKEQAARKAFEVNKKMKMASTVIATASGVMAMLSAEPQGPWNFALAAMVGAMGAASLAQIAGTSFQGGSSAAPAAPSAISMGERSNTVDLGKGNNAGGELAYMRGSSGQGTGATDFKPTPAFSGYKTKNRASGGYIVGEQGPEVFMPDTAGSIIPSGQSTGGSTNVSFNIQAIDASGVEDVLIAQKGQIIRMIREAANEHGEFFLENVREEAYQQ